MNKALLLLLSVCFFVQADILHAQEVPMRHYTTEDGLPSNTIYSAYRDKKGFLWFATDKGIARYNGRKFEKFTMSDGLADNEVFFLKEDLYGRLWMATYSGDLGYYKDDTFHNKNNTPFLRLPSKVSFIRFIALQKDSSIIINFYDWTTFIEIKGEKVKMIHLPRHGVGDLFYSVIHIEKENENYSFLSAARSILVDSNGKILSSTINKWNDFILRTVHDSVNYFVGFKHIYSSNGSVTDYAPSFAKDYVTNGHVQNIFFGRKNIYVSTNTGLVINSYKKGSIDDSFKILKGSDVTSVVQDIENNFWVTTLNNGVFNLNNSFYNSYVIPDAYKGKVIYAATQKNRVFFTTADNNLYTLKNGRQPECLLDYHKVRRDYKTAPMPGILLTDSGRYYSLYNNDFIEVKDIMTTNPKVSWYKNQSIGGSVMVMYFVHGQVMFFHKRGIHALDIANIKPGEEVGPYIKLVTTDLQNASRIFDIAQAPDQSLWYSTLTDVYKLVDSTSVRLPQFGKTTFKRLNFFGRYLVGYTHDNQLLVCTDVDGSIKMKTVPDQHCIWDKFYALDSNHLLITTNGLHRLLTLGLPEDKDKFVVSTIENPFVPVEAEAICSDSAYCYFFKNGSVTAIDLKSLLVRAKPPRVFFTLLKWGKRIQKIGSDEIAIPYADAKNITISFGCLAFSGKDVIYEYSVTREDGEPIWQKVNGDQINMINPRFGTYTVRIRARNISSEASQPQTFVLIVKRPYWATWWFITLIILALAAVVTFIIRRRISNTLKKRQREHETEVKFMKSEYKALNALMNPHFIFNTLNNVQGLVNRNDKLAANEYLRVFADLIRQNMHNVSKELIPLQKEIDLVSNYLRLEKLRFKDHLNYSIDVDDQIDLSDIMVPPLLIQPLVENSIKHGILPLESSNGFVQIKIYEHNNILFITIRDNGVGMEESKKKKNMLHESFGMENIRKRIQQLSIIQDKQISMNIREDRDENGKLQWTAVIISLPL